jgi:hypothetical protein
MSEEMAERLLAVLERIAVQLEQRPLVLGPHPGVTTAELNDSEFESITNKPTS